MARLTRLVLALLASAALSACTAHEREVVRPGPPCPGGLWVPGHYGSNGLWHPGNWRCTGLAEEGVVVFNP